MDARDNILSISFMINKILPHCVALLFVIVGCNNHQVDRLPLKVASYTAGSMIPFIAIDVKTGDSVRAAVIPNDILYDLFEEYSLGTEEYEATLSKYVNTRTPIILPESVLVDLRPYFVRRVPKVDSLASRNAGILIRHYFNEHGILHQNVSPEEERYLINVLFEKGYYTGINHHSGRLGLISGGELTHDIKRPSIIEEQRRKRLDRREENP